MKKDSKKAEQLRNIQKQEQHGRNYGMGSPMFIESVAVQVDRRKSSRRNPSNILQQAEKLIYGDRNKTYSHPNENFENIANLFNAYFEAISRRPGVMETTTFNHDAVNPPHNIKGRFKINRIDIAFLNILQKVARGATNQQHEDTVIDIAGYAGCIERMLKSK